MNLVLPTVFILLLFLLLGMILVFIFSWYEKITFSILNLITLLTVPIVISVIIIGGIEIMVKDSIKMNYI
ncbi:hypothetical protein [[Mycoplasma] collis]|uniref:hypothetical protein n=1 Tax=[Mycoplasma] collis TaxID=2127 RepID=UPI00051B7A96|nr:hypothetical protein [[Mycoplasma] collis]